jgi:hypothetical protein
MKTYTQFEQGSVAWFEARAGKVTASELKNLLTPALKLRTGETPHTYLCRKLAEKLGGPLPGFTSFATEQGTLREEDAIPWFEMEYDCDVQRVAFIEHDDGRSGCSPDGLLGDNEGLEIKCPQRHTHVKYLLDNELPEEYVAQVHGSLYITGRQRWTFLSYCPPLRPLVLKIERDEAKMKAIGAALSSFYTAFDASLAQLTA